jgi:ribose transport system ATP-binding protein
MDVPWNVSLMNIRKLCKHGILRYRLIEENSERFIRKLQIKVPETNMKVANLSGGNQQKVALAKTLASDCNILIFDEPTRGIDVGAKQEIYLLMRSLANEGHAIIMISSDMEELLGMSDRLVVIRDGQLAAEMQKDEFSQVKVLEYASGMVS